LDKPIRESFTKVYDEREDIISRYKGTGSFIKEYESTGKELDEIWEK